MKVYFLAFAAACIGSPVFAQEFKGPWVEARIGFDRAEAAGVGASGFYYGGGLGYDLPIGKTAVVGVQAGISDSTARICALGACANADRDIEVLGRVGAQVADHSLLYVLGGYSNARVSVPGLGSGDADGYRVGAGFELAYNRHLFGKFEYRYSGYDFDVTRHQVTVSLGYRF